MHQATGHAGNAGTPDDRRSGCIVLIDDEEPILDVMYALLHDDEGYLVVAARNAQEALSVTLPAPPALVLLDARLRDGDPETIVAALRQRPGWNVAALVLCSGIADIHDLVKRLGVDGSLSKPFDLDDLLTLVRRFVQPPR